MRLFASQIYREPVF